MFSVFCGGLVATSSTSNSIPVEGQGERIKKGNVNYTTEDNMWNSHLPDRVLGRMNSFLNDELLFWQNENRDYTDEFSSGLANLKTTSDILWDRVHTALKTESVGQKTIL